MLEGKFLKIAEGRLAYEIFEAEPDYLKTVHRVLTEQFGFRRKKLCGMEIIIGLDEVLCSYARNSLQLEVGWDSWSGCYLFATEEAGDEVVRGIGAYLDELLRHE
jgi:hypothetical protein